jgi:UDP-N-acetylmuramyl pentapeptide phosphotransferase/UDP-N-acetylglucosamine-1-phosphate transferase
MIGAITAGGCIGFLFKNWHPARIFMGDVGSAFLGFVFGVIPVLALASVTPASDPLVTAKVPVFAVLVVWPFVADGSFTFCRRLLKGERVWEAHRSHLYQRMVQAGWNHAAVTLYYGFGAILCTLAAGLYLIGKIEATVWVSPLLFFGLTWYLTTSLERKKRVAAEITRTSGA